MNVEDLELLGLTQNESKVYIAMLKKGSQRAAELVKESGVSSSKIYEVLASLEKKHFTQLIPEKVKKYAPMPFDTVKNILDDKQKKIKELSEELKELETYSKQEQKIFIVRGKKAFHQAIKRKTGPKTFGYGIKWKMDIVDKNIAKNVMRNIRGGMKEGGTLYSSNVEQKNIDFWKKIEPRMKPIETNGVAIDIHDHGVMISTLELDATVFIDSPNVAQVMRQLVKCYLDNN